MKLPKSLKPDVDWVKVLDVYIDMETLHWTVSSMQLYYRSQDSMICDIRMKPCFGIRAFLPLSFQNPLIFVGALRWHSVLQDRHTHNAYILFQLEAWKETLHSALGVSSTHFLVSLISTATDAMLLLFPPVLLLSCHFCQVFADGWWIPPHHRPLAWWQRPSSAWGRENLGSTDRVSCFWEWPLILSFSKYPTVVKENAY